MAKLNQSQWANAATKSGNVLHFTDDLIIINDDNKFENHFLQLNNSEDL